MHNGLQRIIFQMNVLIILSLPNNYLHWLVNRLVTASHFQSVLGAFMVEIPLFAIHASTLYSFIAHDVFNLNSENMIDS